MTKPTGESVYGSRPIKRPRRTRGELDRLHQALYDLLANDHPMTVRQVFYRAVSAGIVPKTEAAYKNSVGRSLVAMRRSGVLPWSWIADNTRWQRKPTTYSTMEQALERTARCYRRALWDNQEAYVEVWTEKDALAGVLLDVTREWDVPLLVTKGFSSVSYLYEAAQTIAATGKPAYLYYFGDHDPSGIHIDRSIEKQLREMAPDAEIHFERVAVKEAQITALGLPTRPTKRTDSRAKTFKGESVEVDAIPPATLRQMVRTCIEQHVDRRQLDITRLAEAREREILTDIARCGGRGGLAMRGIRWESQGSGTFPMKSIELFAGAGGLAFGTAEAGFQHKIVIEWDANACATLRKNHDNGVRHVRDWDIIEEDVGELDFTPHRDQVDFVCGGPPCQPFSLGGKHKGQQDHRNLFPQAVRAVREVRPKAFIFENVRGLLRRNFANYYSYILHQLRYPTVVPKRDEDWTEHLARLERLHTRGEKADLRYNVVYRLVNAVNYGVPQHRWRVFIVGIRSDLGGEFSFPAQTHDEDGLLYAKWVSGEYWERHRIPKKRRPQMPPELARRVASLRNTLSAVLLPAWRTVRDAISGLPRIAVGRTSSKVANHFLNPGARSYAGHTGSPYDEPAKALKAGDHGVPGGENMLRLEDGSVRYFSVRECARLQTFPDEWTFEGSWTESMRQLGNAVPVKLAEDIARPLVAMIAAPEASARLVFRPKTG